MCCGTGYLRITVHRRNMAYKIALLACIVVAALADRAPVYHPPLPYAPYPAPDPYKEPEYPTEPPKYAFNYNVNDHYSGADFEASESRDGYTTQGEYRVLLPDTRVQIVKYVDNGDGLIAEVTYEGEAQFPEYKPEPKYAPHPPKYAPEPPKYVPHPPKYAPEPPKYVPHPPEYIPHPPEYVPHPPTYAPPPPVYG